MAETNVNQNAQKAKPKAAAFETPKLEMPKFEMPKFEMPNLGVPAAFREFAEKGVAQAKENYEKFKSIAEETTDLMEDTYATASKGVTDYGAKVLEAARVNVNAAFDFYGELLGAKSYADVVELTSGYARKQFDTVTAQTKDLALAAQKVATETAEPIKEGFTSAIRKAA